MLGWSVMLATLSLGKVRKLSNIRNRYNQVSHLTKDTTSGSDKNTIKHHKVSPFTEGDHKAAMNSRKTMTNTRHK